MLFRGNVILQSSEATNTKQIIALFNDNDAHIAPLSLKLRMISNTVFVTIPGASVVHLSNADRTTMVAEISNNVFSGGTPTTIDDAATGTVTGTNNWLPTGTPPGTLVRSVFGASAPFNDGARADFTLTPGSNAIRGASVDVVDPPVREYFQNEIVARQYRARATAKDIGAFESTTTGAGIGPRATPPSVAPANASAASTTSAPDGAIGAPPPATTNDARSLRPSGASDGGCGCRNRRAAAGDGAMLAAGAFALAFRVRRRRR
jgi:hypothetical protein